jgi:hypothetical protein
MHQNAWARRIAGGASVAGIVLLFGTNAYAGWWKRTPGASCATIPPDLNVHGSGMVAGFQQGQGLAGNVDAFQLFPTFIAFCPFEEMSIVENGAAIETLDSDISSASNVTVDMANITPSTIGANTIRVEACRFSDWAYNCGAPTWNSSIPPFGIGVGHIGLRVADVSQWTSDGGNGYAHLAIYNINTPSVIIAGILIAE